MNIDKKKEIKKFSETHKGDKLFDHVQTEQKLTQQIIWKKVSAVSEYRGGGYEKH